VPEKNGVGFTPIRPHGWSENWTVVRAGALPNVAETDPEPPSVRVVQGERGSVTLAPPDVTHETNERLLPGRADRE